MTLHRHRLLRLVHATLLAALTFGVAAMAALSTAVLPCLLSESAHFRKLPTTVTDVPLRSTKDGWGWSANISSKPGQTVARTWFSRKAFDPTQVVGAKDCPSWIYGAEHLRAESAGLGNLDSFAVVDVGFGWPKPLVAYRTHWDVNSASKAVRPRTIYGTQFRLGSGFSETPVWPTRILWSGLLFDLLVMVPMAALIVYSPSAVRAARRSPRREYQHCAACGYARFGETEEWTCPECGSFQRLEPPIGWTIRFSALSFFKRPRLLPRLFFLAVCMAIAAAIGVFVAGFIGPM